MFHTHEFPIISKTEYNLLLLTLVAHIIRMMGMQQPNDMSDQREIKMQFISKTIENQEIVKQILTNAVSAVGYPPLVGLHTGCSVAGGSAHDCSSPDANIP